ncbi:carbamoyltransferase family protein [Lentibacter sp.]|uniref:carbamoyltransferase family protein n=1 Tax=Lentibacter sp. TaxID=2024994 RepID=UPI003F6C6209
MLRFYLAPLNEDCVALYTLGLATMDNSAAALMHNGVLLAAVENERLTRAKNDGSFPFEAIDEVLRIAGITAQDIGLVAVYWQPWRLRGRSFGTLAKMLRAPSQAAAPAARALQLFRRSGAEGAAPSGSWADLFRLRRKLISRYGNIPAAIRYYDHHLTHQLYAEAMQGWDNCLSLSLDGGGEDASTVLTAVQNGTRTELSRHRWPNSLGHFYSVFTGYLGFQMLEGEYKMMGLAPYGTPVWKEDILRHILRLRSHGRYQLNTRLADYHGARSGRYHARLKVLFGPPRAADEEPTQDHINLAASVQAAYEEALAHVLAPARAAYPALSRVALSGGCALNVTANGALLSRGLVSEVSIPPAPHDAGCAIGACIAAHHGTAVTADKAALRSPYLGAAFEDADICAALEGHIKELPTPLPDAQLAEQTAKRLASGQIIAWFQGGAEFGPRALGARSFLADPRQDSIRDALNDKIKKRELFRPFAPSVTEEAAQDYFTLAQPSPYMNIVAPVTECHRADIPAVTHTDGSARVHTVSQGANPLYHALLSAFGRATGVPVLLNTSFNIQEPIVYSPADAVATFRASGVDALVIGPYIIAREQLT